MITLALSLAGTPFNLFEYTDLKSEVECPCDLIVTVLEIPMLIELILA